MNRAHFLTGLAAAGLLGTAAAGQGWRTDPAWYEGKAEWALYDAVRPLYGSPRLYEATIFTNRQHMDPATTTKASDWQAGDAIEVFKHNVSEMVPSDNYTYRFLTTTFHHADDLAPYKVVASTQEDCGTTYKQFTSAGDALEAVSFSYFPDEGTVRQRIAATPRLAFHDGLTLTLRDYPFDDPEKPVLRLDLVADLTHTHNTPLEPEPATVEYIACETIFVPFGSVDAHHLRVTHAEAGGTTTSDYWFAADPKLRHVLVKYTGPHGVAYQLKRLDWWAYWRDPVP